MNFSQALELLKEGKLLARKGWNGKGMFIYLVRESLVKHENFRNEAAVAIKKAYEIEGNVNNLPSDRIVNAHIDMKDAYGHIAVGWLASQADMLAEDWELVE